jgi:CRISPR/Cas system-associated exonuclease Cas4 (RecB family)
VTSIDDDMPEQQGWLLNMPEVLIIPAALSVVLIVVVRLCPSSRNLEVDGAIQVHGEMEDPMRDGRDP